MKLRDGGTTVLIVFAAFYFIDWAVEKVDPEPQKCYVQSESDGLTVGRWINCDEIPGNS